MHAKMNRRNLVFESIVYAPYTFRDRKILRLDRLPTLRTVKISVPVKFRLPAARSAIRTEKILFFPTFFKTFHFPVYLAFVIGAHLPGNCSTFPRTNETPRILLRLSFVASVIFASSLRPIVPWPFPALRAFSLVRECCTRRTSSEGIRDNDTY